MHLEKKWKSIRVAILAKHGGFLRWHTDLAEGFAQIGAHVNSINLRPSGFAEIRKKIKTGCSTFNNQAIQHRVATQLNAAKPDLVIMMNRPGLTHAAHELWRTVIPRKSLIVGWLCDSWEEIPASDAPNFDILFHCRPTVWTWRALSLEFARRREGFGGMPIASFFRVVDISFEYRGDAVP
jgi:hypothetical protein